MTLQKILDYFNDNRRLPECSVICFFGKEYPFLFFSHIISFLQKHTYRLERIDVGSTELSLARAHISTMSFSGKLIYVLKDFHTLNAKKQREWLLYLQSYTGPHTLLFFTNDETATNYMAKQEHTIYIPLPENVSLHDYSKVRFLIDKSDDYTHKKFGLRLASYTNQLSLDNAFLFVHYEMVIGNNVDDFFREWITRIVEPEHSLFLLSQHFFSKKSQHFFEQWAHDCEIYLSPFWVTFWADQLWRAYIYCDFMQQKKYAEAKKSQFKLPFSLINRDWSSLQLNELRQAHEFLSTMDFRLKNGGSPVALELFYGMFFENKFR